MKKLFTTLVLAVSAALSTGAIAAAPAAADTYAYRVTNGYNGEVAGEVTYRIEKRAANRVSVAVATTASVMGEERTELYDREGNGLHHPLTNRGYLVDYEFAAAYPAYQFPLETGKSWSIRVMATVPATQQRRSVRVDAEVLGPERVTVPAGTFDTIKIRRVVYPGDADPPRNETQIVEHDWYAPALGRTVRSVTRSGYLDQSMGGKAPLWVSGDWNVLELLRPAAK